MPPASLVRLNAASIPSFIWRPSSLAAPESGPTIPNLISLSVTPWTEEVAVAVGGRGAVGAVAAAADGGPITPHRGVELPRPSDRSRSENCRSAVFQRTLPELRSV